MTSAARVDVPWSLNPRPVFGIAGKLALTAALVVAVTSLRMGLGVISPTITPFAGYYLATLAVSILCGWRWGLLALAAGGGAAWWFFLAPLAHEPLLRIGAPLSLLIYLLSGGAVVWTAAYLRQVVGRLQESRRALLARSLQYENLFDTMSEGFALADAIRDESGRLTDYVVVEINPALRRMLGVGSEIVGSRFRERFGEGRQWLALCDQVMRTGEPASFEFAAPSDSRSFEIRVSRVSANRMAQFFFDITDRKAAQARQSELYQELNHRVKNNLTLVAGLLQMQARNAGPAVQEQLAKAADRVQSIAQVHQALSRGARNDDVDFATYLKDLCASLARSLAPDGRISLEVEAEPADLPIATVIPLGIVVNELVTNAVKHAYPPPQTGIVSVDFRRAGDAYRLTVGDGGQGLPERVATQGGLGMTLVNSLVRQVRGEMISRRDPGATFEITVPPPGSAESVLTENARLL